MARPDPRWFRKMSAIDRVISNVLPVTEEVADKAIDLRRHWNGKLADSIIAATAMVNDLKLVTRNSDDFKGLTTLEIVNPFQ